MLRRTLRDLRAICVPALLALAACTSGVAGSSSDDAEAFAGAWYGTASASGGGQSALDAAATVTLSPSGFDTLQIGGLVCGGSPAPRPQAFTQGPAALQIGAVSCAAAFTLGCPSASLAVTGGSGSLAGGTLTLALSGTLTGCGTSTNVSVVFTGTRNHAGGGAPTVVVRAPATARRGQVVTFDASGSSDPGGHRLQFAWTLLGSPAGAAGALGGATTAIATLTPDQDGPWTVHLLVTGSGGSAETTLALLVGSGTTPPPPPPPPPDHPPVVDLRGPATGVAGSPLSFDAGGSSDPKGRALSFSWALTAAPGGSQATLPPGGGSKVVLTADFPGSYTVSVTVSNGSLSAVASATVVVSAITPPPPPPEVPPVAVLVATPAAASVFDNVTFDASGSSDPKGRPLTFAWLVQARPAGGTDKLKQTGGATAVLTPDAAGAWTVQVTVSNGALSTQASVTVPVAAASGGSALGLLGFRPTAARYSRAIDKLLLIASAPNQLHLYDPASQKDVALDLKLEPRCLDVSSDGLFAAVGHDAWVSYVDLAAAKVLAVWPITATAGDVVLGESLATASGGFTRMAYVFPARDQWVAIHDLDLVSGAEATSGNQVYAGTLGRLQPGQPRLFSVTAGLSPAQLYRFTLDAKGITDNGTGSPYWGDHPMAGPLWISADGQQLLTGAGTRYRPTDLTYAGTVDLGTSSPGGPSFVSLSGADYAGGPARWLVQPAAAFFPTPGAVAQDLALYVVDGQFLSSAERTAYPGYQRGSGPSYPVHGRWVFWDKAEAHKIAVVQVDPAANLLQDFGVVVF